MSKRIYVSVSDDFYDWIVVESEKNGLPIATFATTLLNQARRNIQTQFDFSRMMGVLSKVPSETLCNVIKSGNVKLLDSDIFEDSSGK